jgi:hypothetical protein
MPFDGLTTEQLHKEWENYTRQIAGGATLTAASVLSSLFTVGISLVGIGLSAPCIHPNVSSASALFRAITWLSCNVNITRKGPFWSEPPPHIPVYQLGMGQPVQLQSYGARPSFQGSQGWQWGVAPTKPNREPDYGVPPTIPAP